MEIHPSIHPSIHHRFAPFLFSTFLTVSEKVFQWFDRVFECRGMMVLFSHGWTWWLLLSVSAFRVILNSPPSEACVLLCAGGHRAIHILILDWTKPPLGVCSLASFPFPMALTWPCCPLFGSFLSLSPSRQLVIFFLLLLLLFLLTLVSLPLPQIPLFSNWRLTDWQHFLLPSFLPSFLLSFFPFLFFVCFLVPPLIFSCTDEIF